MDQPDHLRPEQALGPIHVHPNGQFVYLGNRASGLAEAGGRKAAAGGENTIAVFAIDPATGKPTLIQNAGTRGYHPRTFSLDPTGRMLVVANLLAMSVADGETVRTQPATLSTFRVGADGKLSFVRSYDVESGSATQWWSGMVGL